MRSKDFLEYLLYTAEGLEQDAPPVEFGLLVKAVTFGNVGVGKRHFVHRLMHVTWKSPTMRVGIGVDFAFKRMTSSASQVAEDVYLQIWGTAGAERFRADLSPLFTRGATIWYLCFEHRPTLDLTDKDSITAHCKDALDQLGPWFKDLSAASAVFPAPVLTILVGLKADVLTAPALSSTPGLEAFNSQPCVLTSEAICSKLSIASLFHPLQCFHVSSKSTEGINELLQYSTDTIRDIFRRFPRGIPVVGVSSSGVRPGAVKLPQLVNRLSQ